MKPKVEFMVRVKLPSSSGFHSSPSGDTEYEEAFRKAILSAKPEGFEVIWPKLNQKWAVDSEGLTCVPLFLSDKKQAENGTLMYWIDRASKLSCELTELREKIRKLGSL